MANTKKDFTPSEQRLLAYLPDDGVEKITTTQLIRKMYPTNQPKNARQTVNWMVRTLTEKIKGANTGFVIHRTDRSGPHEISYWVTLQKKNAVHTEAEAP